MPKAPKKAETKKETLQSWVKQKQALFTVYERNYFMALEVTKNHQIQVELKIV